MSLLFHDGWKSYNMKLEFDSLKKARAPGTYVFPSKKYMRTTYSLNAQTQI